MATTGRMYDVPPLGTPIRLRGVRASVVLDEFAPTEVDAWYATAYLGDLTVPAVVVRRAGDVARHGLLHGRGADVPPPPEPGAVLGVVVDEAGARVRWLPPGSTPTDLGIAADVW